MIFTDGTTLLGADDKAGIAEIMQMVAWIKTHPEVPHARLCIGFTPDEEVARGTENFDIPPFGAAYAYTFDGGEIGTLESENFNAGTALVTIRGVGVHPGLSKGKMVNSVRYAARLIDRLPIDQAPETTGGPRGLPASEHGKGDGGRVRRAHSGARPQPCALRGEEGLPREARRRDERRVPLRQSSPSRSRTATRT